MQKTAVGKIALCRVFNISCDHHRHWCTLKLDVAWKMSSVWRLHVVCAATLPAKPVQGRAECLAGTVFAVIVCPRHPTNFLWATCRENVMTIVELGCFWWGGANFACATFIQCEPIVLWLVDVHRSKSSHKMVWRLLYRQHVIDLTRWHCRPTPLPPIPLLSGSGCADVTCVYNDLRRVSSHVSFHSETCPLSGQSGLLVPTV